MPLTDMQAKNADPKDKPYRLMDGGGLFLWVTPAGGRFWRYRYERKGKEQTLSLGEYPMVKLSQARVARDRARQIIRSGADPNAPAELTAPSKPSFKEVTESWLVSQSRIWAPRHARKVRQAIEKWVFPNIGETPIDQVSTADVAAILQALDSRGAQELLRQTRVRVAKVFDYAAGQGLVEKNPAKIAGLGLPPQIKGRNPAITDLDDLRHLLATVDALPARPITRLAMRLLALTAVRQGEMRIATWSEFHGLEGERPEWRIPIGHMKIPRAKRLGLPEYHSVPLSRQAVETLLVLREITGHGPLPFPSATNAHRPMSENALSEVLVRAGFRDRHVPHGFRASFSTIMNERHPTDRLTIDYMLGHKLRDQVESAYNRAEHRDRRRALAQIWADLLLQGLSDARELVELPRRPFKACADTVRTVIVADPGGKTR